MPVPLLAGAQRLGRLKSRRVELGRVGARLPRAGRDRHLVQRYGMYATAVRLVPTFFVHHRH